MATRQAVRQARPARSGRRIGKSWALRGGGVPPVSAHRDGQLSVGGAAFKIYAAGTRYAQKCKEFVLIRTDKGRSVV